MDEEIKNYTCPACGASLRYDSESGRLMCDYCDSSYELSVFQNRVDPDEAERRAQDSSGSDRWEDAEYGSQWGKDADNMISYVCPSCGAEMICDRNTAATACPYCGNNAVIPGKFSGESLKPDYVLPFKISKDEAESALREHYKGKILLPKVFSSENHIKEVKGIYVPFWLFDGESRGDQHYTCTRSTVTREGKYEVTRTRYYDVYRAGNLSFEKVPADASSKMPDDYMDSIEPYDYSELRDFSTLYLPGFLADKYDVEAAEATKRANARIRNSFEAALKNSVKGYESVIPDGGSYRLQPGRIGYALMPVWLLSTRWRDKNYLFAVNGQTGKMVGDLPIDKTKQNIWFWSLFAGLGAVLSVFLSGPFGRMFMNFFG